MGNRPRRHLSRWPLFPSLCKGVGGAFQTKNSSMYTSARAYCEGMIRLGSISDFTSPHSDPVTKCWGDGTCRCAGAGVLLYMADDVWNSLVSPQVQAERTTVRAERTGSNGVDQRFLSADGKLWLSRFGRAPRSPRHYLLDKSHYIAP